MWAPRWSFRHLLYGNPIRGLMGDPDSIYRCLQVIYIWSQFARYCGYNIHRWCVSGNVIIENECIMWKLQNEVVEIGCSWHSDIICSWKLTELLLLKIFLSALCTYFTLLTYQLPNLYHFHITRPLSTTSIYHI